MNDLPTRKELDDESAEKCPDCGHVLIVDRVQTEFWGVKATHTERSCRNCDYYEGP